MRDLLDAIQDAYQSLEQHGFGRFLAGHYRALIGEEATAELPSVLATFSALTADQHMGDGGTYRSRAYSRFRLDARGAASTWTLSPLPGNSIFQALEDNAVNGGVTRTYEPLAPEIAESPLLKALIFADFTHAFNCDRSLRLEPLAVGVHQVRIVAKSEMPGLPTPEGIHRDRELYTFQHFMARCNVDGGEFRAYDESKELLFSWTQEDALDTVMFKGTTWHSATPIAARAPGVVGYRDIFLIDFDRLPGL